MKIVCLICMVLVTLSLATTAQGIELSSIASLPCSLFGFGCPCPTLPLPRPPVCLFPTTPLPSVYQDIKGGNHTGFVHVCTNVPLRPLPLTHLNTVSYNDALDMVNLNLYQTQIELNVAKKGEKEASRKLEDSTQALATSLKDLAAAEATLAALRAQLEQYSQNIKSLESNVLSQAKNLVNEKLKNVDLVKRLDAAIDKAEQMERKAHDNLILSENLANENHALNHKLKSGSLAFALFILFINVIGFVVWFVRSSSPRIHPTSSSASNSPPPKSDSFSPRYSVDENTAEDEVNGKSTGKCNANSPMLRFRKVILDFIKEEKAIEEARYAARHSKPIIESCDDDKDSEEGDKIRKHQMPIIEDLDKELDESDFLPDENRSIYVKGNFETTSIYSKLVSQSDKEDSTSDL